MAVPVPYAAAFPDGTAYPTIPAGTSVVNVSTSSQLTSALSSATAGQRIVLANGTYSGTFTISGKTGTSSNGISIEANTVGGAVFASGSKFTISNCAYVTVKGLSFPYDVAGDLFQFRGSTHHSRMTRCTIGPASHTASSEVATYIYVGDTAQFIRIDHNEIRNKGTSGNGVRVYGSFDTYVGCQYVRIDHNIFRSIKPEVGNDKEPIRYGVSTMSRTDGNGVIERNFFTDCLCEPEIVSGKMGKLRITGNVLYRCAGGAVIRHGRNSILNDNYIIDGNNTTASAGLESGGIRFYDSGHQIAYNYINATIGDTFQDPLLLDTGDAEGSSTNLAGHWRVINALVERNVLLATPRGITIGDNYSLAPQNCTIKDNLVVNTPTGTALTQVIAPSGGSITGNLYFASTAAASMTLGADTIYRKADYGPRLTYFGQSDVGPAGDTSDADGTGALVSGGGGGGGGDSPATVLDIGTGPTEQHFELTYGIDGTSGGSQTTKTLADIEGGFADANYFSVVTGSGGVTQTLGVGGIPTATAGSGVTLIGADSGSTLNISASNVTYDGQGHTVPKINITGSNVTVQNFYVRGGSNSGIYSLGSNNTIQNNDVAQITVADDDINGITFFGDGHKILFNKVDNLVSGAPGAAHTDGIQTWATPSKNSSSNVTIKGNWINGPAQSDVKYIHQGIMAEGPESTDGGGGGSGVSRNWVVDGNYFKTYGNQCLKFDDIHDVVITRNIFAGSATKLVETGDFSTGIVFYRDNTITGSYGSNGISITPTDGPGSTTATANAVKFRVRADAASGGSSFPRNELREVLADGSTYAFDAMHGDHKLHTRARVTHVPSADPEVIVAQLHDGTNDRVSIRTQLISGQTVLVCRINGTNATPQFANPYVVGTEFEVEIRVADGGAVSVFYNGASTPIVTGQLVTSGSASWFFRVGAHAQFTTATAGSSTEFVTVEHRDIQVSHTGSFVSAGADARVLLGNALNRTASEVALSGVTSRKWEIVSGPAGTLGPTADLTSAAGRYGWGDPIAAWSDEFNYTGAPNSSKWGVYNGVGHDGNGRRRPERANVDGEKLVMDGLANGDSAGMASRFDQQYGRWECRARSFNTGTSGAEYSPVLLIWPESDSRKSDGEYDFSEPGSPGSTELTAFMHFPGDGDQQREFNKTGVNLADWHNFALEWTPSYLKGYLDGVEWFNTSGGANSSRDNIQDMPAGHVCIQLDNFNGDSGNRPARFEVDWSRVYTLTPTGGGGGGTTQLSTTAAVSWTPTVLGTYVLRYTAVATAGTFTDEVTVVVTDTAAEPITIVPNPIVSAESWGLPTVEVEPPAGAVPSLLGAMILGENAYLGYAPGPTSLMIVPVSIPTAEHWGVPTVVVEDPPVPQDIYPDSIPTRERWGAPVVTVGAAPPDLPVTDLTISLFAIDPSEGRGLPLPDFVSLTLSPERNSPGSISVDYPAEGINFGFLREAITDGRDVQVEIWVSGTSNRALRGYLQEAQGDDTNEDGEIWTFAGQFLEVRMSDAVIEPQDPGPSPAMAADLIAQRMISGGHIDDDLTWDGAPQIVETYAPLILEQWIDERDEDDTSPIPNLAWLVAYVGDPPNQEHANEKREMIFASATPGQVMIYAMDQARRRGTLTDVAVDFTADYDSDGVEWPQVISTRFSPGAEYARILEQLVSLGLAEWAVEWTGTAQVLRMWVPEGRGVDLTENDPPLVLRHGQNLLDAPHKWSLRDTGTYVLVAGADGLYDTASDATATAVRGRRIERFTSANNLNTPTAVEAYAQQQLTVVTTPLLEVTHGIGMQPGSPRPLASFDVGDWLYSDTDGLLTRYRVVQWTLTVGNDQSLSGTVTLNDTAADALLRLKARMDALTAGETVVGTSEGAFQSDDGVPLAPTGVVASSLAFLVPSEPSATNPDLPPGAEIHAAVTVGWLPVTHNTNGSAASDLGGYKVQYAYDQQPDLWIGLEDVGPNRQSSTFDASPGVNLAVRVAAYDRNGNQSDWSEVVHHTVAVDDQPPAAPSTPAVTDYLGTIRVFWDGNTSDGIDIVLAAPDFDYIEVHMDAGSNFTPSGSTKVGQMRGPGAFSITDMPYGVQQFVRLVAVDKGGNASSPSAQASATPGKLVNIDIGPDAISRVQIIDGEIVNAKIADLAVNDAKISSLAVGKLTAGFLSADVIMSTGEIRTGVGNTYGIFSSGGLQFYRAGLLTVDLNAATGDALITGTYRSGLVGERINILPDGTLRIYGASGTDYGEIRNDGGIWRATSRADSLGRRSYLDMNPGGLTAWYGTIGERRSKIDVNYDYAVLTAAVTGVRIWDQFNPSDNTENRFHFVFANSGGDIEDSVVHFVRNPFKSTNPAFNAPGIQGGEASGITFRNNAVAATRGDGNAYVFVDGAEFHALSSELNKREIAPIRFTGGRTARDVIDSVASYGWTYDFPASPRTVDVQRRQPDGSMATETVDVDTTPTEPPRRHYFPIAEHLAAVAPELVRTTPEGEYMVGIRDSLGVVWETVRELSAELRYLRRFVGLDESRPVVIEGNVIDPTRWKQLPE